MTDKYLQWDAAYVLGALSATDRLEFEGHLSECDVCRRAVADLAGMPGILAKLPAADAIAASSSAEPERLVSATGPGVVQALARLEVRQRRWRVATISLAAAAVVVVALGGLWGANLLNTTTPSQQMTALGQDVVTAQLAVTSESYGSRIEWSCQYPGGWVEKHSYDLVVIDTAGTTSTVATWSSGTDMSGLVATTAIPASTIRSVEIRLAGSDAALLRESF